LNFGENHSEVAIVQSNLALVYQDLGDYEKARDLLEKALKSDLKNFGELHPNVAIRKWNLGTVYIQLNDKRKAKELIGQAYDIFLKKLGREHPHTVNCKQWLDSL
jgi:tetratricopeptide (TPR) repeat protein